LYNIVHNVKHCTFLSILYSHYNKITHYQYMKMVHYIGCKIYLKYCAYCSYCTHHDLVIHHRIIIQIHHHHRYYIRLFVLILTQDNGSEPARGLITVIS
jgi:hypothetical protein